MKQKIGNVTIDYTNYPGKDLYTDGDIEDILLDIVKTYPQDKYNQIIWEKKSWPILYHLSHIRGNVVEWIPIEEQASILEVGSGCGAITGTLSKKAKKVTCIELSEKRSLINAYRNRDCDNIEIKLGNFRDVEKALDETFDYIMLIGVLEYAGLYVDSVDPYNEFMSMIAKHLKPNGKIVVAIENRLGLKYWAGCQEDHLGGYFKGLEGYSAEDGVRTFCRDELIKLAERQGFCQSELYYPYPDYKLPMVIYSDDRLPMQGELVTNLRNYDRERMMLFSEKKVYDALITAGLFPEFSNSFVMIMQKECQDDRKKIYVKYSNDRATQFGIKTEISISDKKKAVAKVPMSSMAKEHLSNMVSNAEKIAQTYASSNIKMNQVKEMAEGVIFEYVDGQTLEQKLDKLLYAGEKEQVIEQITEYARVIQEPYHEFFQYSDEFENVFGVLDLPEGLYAADCADIDMIFSNIILDGDVWNVIDYEWSFDFKIPLHYILYRSIYYYIECVDERNKLIDVDDVYGCLGITLEERKLYAQMEQHFQEYTNSNVYSLWKFYDSIGKRSIMVDEILKREEYKITDYNMQIFWKKNGEFTENHSVMLEPRKVADDVLVLEYTLEEACDGIRIDPGNRCCYITVLELTDENGDSLMFDDNGIHLEDGRIVYLTEDPNMTINRSFDAGSKVVFKMHLEFVKADIGKQLGNVYEQHKQCILNGKRRVENLDAEVDQLKKQIDELNKVVLYKESVISAMESSTSWKMTRPIRALKETINRSN